MFGVARKGPDAHNTWEMLPPICDSADAANEYIANRQAGDNAKLNARRMEAEARGETIDDTKAEFLIVPLGDVF